MAERDEHRTDEDAIARFVRLLGGRRPIRKVLIANNGIAAVKAIRSIRRWSYETFGDERAVEFVAMATPEDVTANAEYVRLADIWTSVPGGSNNHNFANVDLIADIAGRYECDAVWAGWGHASEYPALPRKLAELNIVFMGPNAESMHALGDKIASTIIAQSAKVPTVAWSGQGLTVDYKNTGCIPDEVFRKACVTSAEEAESVAERCGYPVVIKASEGGGGKGIRVVLDPTAVKPAYRHVASEIPGSPIFVMRLVKNARHLEVQVVADEYGGAVALHGRDCSVQRRHQKIIEEGPVVAAPPKVWKRLEKAAVALAKEVGYVGAGTVEYLYTGNEGGGEFYFLELNPRLQVEHPVTEWISGINLPALQLHIAMGIPLRNVSCIRRFFGASELVVLDHLFPASASEAASETTRAQIAGNDTESNAEDASRTPMVAASGSPTDTADDEDLLDRDPVPPRGHVIACRVTAENPDEGFQPTSGAIQELMFRNTPNVWGYFSVGASGGVHEFADSQFGHLFAWGENRESSRRSLVLALKELSIRGDIRTTVEYLIKLLEMKDFRDNAIHTAWLDALIAEKVTAEKPPSDLAVIVGAVCRAHMDFVATSDTFIKCLERGQLPPLDRSLVEFPVELIYEDVKYCLSVTRADVSGYRIRLADEDPSSTLSVPVEVRKLADGGLLVLADGRSHVCYARDEPAGTRLSIDGKTCLFPNEYDPTTLRSSVSGKLVRYLVSDGDHVDREQAYAELEVMKMYLSLPAPESGIISIVKPAGSTLEIGDVLAHLELDDPTKVRRSEKFTGALPKFGPPQAPGAKPHQLFRAARKEVGLLLRGFDADRTAIDRMIGLADDPRVAAGELQEALSSLSGRIPPESAEEASSAIDSILAASAQETTSLATTDAPEMQSLPSVNEMDVDPTITKSPVCVERPGRSAVASAVSRIKKAVPATADAAPLLAVATKYEHGGVFSRTMSAVLDEYIEVERPFARSSNSAGDVLFEMRDENRGDLASLVEVAASHIQIRKKNEMVNSFLVALSNSTTMRRLRDDPPYTAEFKARLHQLSQLFAPVYSDIALRARMMLVDFGRPHFRQRHATLEKLLNDVAKASLSDRSRMIQKIAGLGESILDVIVTFVLPGESTSVSPEIRRIAAEVQLLRSYRAYDVSQFVVAVDETEAANLMATWRFRFAKPEKELHTSGPSSPLAGAPPGMMPSSTRQDGISRTSATLGLNSFDSADNLSAAHGGAKSVTDADPYRYGMLAVFSSWDDLEANFDSVFERCTSQIDVVQGLDINVMTVLLQWDVESDQSIVMRNGTSRKAPTGSTDPLAFEEYVSSTLTDFCMAKPSRYSTAVTAGMKTVTFVVAPSTPGHVVTYPGFYTLRVHDSFREDPIFRHIDPPMAFQLELSRLSNFDITRFSYPNRAVHVFFAQDKAAKRKRPGAPPVQRSNQLNQEALPVTPQNTAVESVVAPDVPSPRAPEASLPSDDAKAGKVAPSASLPPAPAKNSREQASGKSGATEGSAAQTLRAEPGATASSRNDSRVDKDVDARFFVRAVIRHVDVFASSSDAIVSIPEAERTFVEALDAVEMASCDRRFRRTDCNHIFLNVIPTVRIDVEDVQKICKRMFMRYSTRCWLLRVFVVEIRVSTLTSEGTSSAAFLPLRFLLYNPTGHVLRVESYIESTDPSNGKVRILSLSSADQGSLHGSLVSEPYQIMDRMQRKRVVAKTIETAYVYDFMQLFAKQLHSRWRQYSEDRLLGGFRRHKVPITPMKATEYILAPGTESSADPQLIPTSRPPGMNDIGMVAWRCTLYTPECPSGRDIVIVANDITFKSGSFGPEEDALFVAASRMARKDGIPRIYLAANSGARIGIAEEVRDRFGVDWVDPNDPTKGFHGLTLTEDDYSALAPYVGKGKKLPSGAVRLDGIVGAQHGLGVENLMGSGLIAGESSAAYDETFTLTYVTARSVGIGAYLVRLGQRVIQKEVGAPIILTGYSALNKVLGHEVYVSNDQLGGTKIMHPNGITHQVVPDDVHGVGAILDWLSFVPAARGQALPVIESRDPVSRDVLSSPPEGGLPYDPRVSLIAGQPAKDRSDFYLGGFFDRYSWRETLDSWAKTVVVGRARLGGVPTGIIAVETRTTERTTPADPASPETHESIVAQAGQVWYPDSAAKTAQAIKDFDREGLPLFVFANWRGFSGGMRDMFDEVLKSGSLIVDALRAYSQPVFVYIPPGGELRGGAWVVLDTLINPAQIEMYADETARGGVLEPEGTVDVKYRRRDLVKTMHRLDPRLRELDEQLRTGKKGNAVSALVSDEEKRSINDAIYAREAEILPAYRSVAASFCDLHDTPGRMHAKGAVRKVVKWKEARGFFYWRLQRRLAEHRVRRLCAEANKDLTHDQVTSLLRKWASADYAIEKDASMESASQHADGSSRSDADASSAGYSPSGLDKSIFDTDDQWVYQWLEVEEDTILRRVEKLRTARIADEVAQLCDESLEGFLEGIERALQGCPDLTQRGKLAAELHARIEQVSSGAHAASAARSLLPPSLLSRLRVGWDASSK